MENVNAEHLKDFVVICVGLSMLVSNLVAILRASATQRRVVEFSEEYIPRDACAATHAGVRERLEAIEHHAEALRQEMREELATLRLNDEQRVKGVHARIDEILGALAKLRPPR